MDIAEAVIAYDATKEVKKLELQKTVREIRQMGGILSPGDTLLVLGIMHTVANPLGYYTKPCTDSFLGTNTRALEEEVSRKAESYADMLQKSADDCEEDGVAIKVKITAGSPMRRVIFQEVISCKATWLILDRQLRRDLKFYEKHIPCKVAIIEDSLSVKVQRSHAIIMNGVDVPQLEFHSQSKSVEPTQTERETLCFEQSVISCGSYCASLNSQESSEILRRSLASSFKVKLQDLNISLHDDASSSMQATTGKSVQENPRNPDDDHSLTSRPGNSVRNDLSQRPVLCAGCGLRTVLYIKESMRFKYSEIRNATADFSNKNLLGEGGFGRVYKGELKDGQLIAAKLRKEASAQGYTEFRSEIFVLSFARHKNIVMLLGHCSQDNFHILVYEYICNKSLAWHLFDKSAAKLEWHQRHAIALGTARGLRFLHEECRGGPIIHRDFRPSNILLTHDFVPMIADFGLAKWKANENPVHSRVLGTLGYLAPEYAENGIISVRTDVYSFGVVLIQLISGRKVLNGEDEQSQSLLQWAEPLIEKLALHELIDPSIGDSYDTYELYHMARTAYLCVRRKPELRPSMGEVVHLLEGENEHVRDLARQFMPQYQQCDTH